MPPQGLMRDAQAGAARLAHADVHVFEPSSERERSRTTDRAGREYFAGGRKFSCQEITTGLSIPDAMRQRRRRMGQSRGGLGASVTAFAGESGSRFSCDQTWPQ
jgi:hypothetical protein